MVKQETFSWKRRLICCIHIACLYLLLGIRSNPNMSNRGIVNTFYLVYKIVCQNGLFLWSLNLSSNFIILNIVDVSDWVQFPSLKNKQSDRKSNKRLDSHFEKS